MPNSKRSTRRSKSRGTTRTYKVKVRRVDDQFPQVPRNKTYKIHVSGCRNEPLWHGVDPKYAQIYCDVAWNAPHGPDDYPYVYNHVWTYKKPPTDRHKGWYMGDFDYQLKDIKLLGAK